MSKYLDQVEEFHKTFKAPVLPSPQLAPADRAKLRVSLIQEELNELQEAIEKGNLVEVADALCDLQYVLSGTVLEFGMKDKFEKMFEEVHRSNMSKACNERMGVENTLRHYREQGVEASYVFSKETRKYLIRRNSDKKILKSIHYSPADLASILKPHCEECGSHFPQEYLDEFSGYCELCFTELRIGKDF